MIKEDAIIKVINNLDPTNIVRGLFIIGLLGLALFLAIFGWVNLRNVRLLNKTLKTSFGIVILIAAILFFAGCVVTLWQAIAIWIKPLLFS
ncbi:hypothetical protein KC614_02775 [candidate division WWE3 bacterium]|uniref:Uncharacterized protein n=1 Tax=candidate division WWE3 bacterium TaxID=2053526 RepID=A0A955LKK5_UNCKA|nr:hypothetical protein [candidate division WWE3 bacterium]